jgi:hypothetical protein
MILRLEVINLLIPFDEAEMESSNGDGVGSSRIF